MNLDDPVDRLRTAIAEFRANMERVLGDLEDDLDELAERFKEAREAEKKLAEIAAIAKP